jgi:hypothetical protein
LRYEVTDSAFQNNKPDSNDIEPQIMMRPTNVKIERCIRCHKKLKFRKPMPEEQRVYREQYMRDWNENICRDEDVFSITDTCECGQEGIVLYNINTHLLK